MSGPDDVPGGVTERVVHTLDGQEVTIRLRKVIPYRLRNDIMDRTFKTNYTGTRLEAEVKAGSFFTAVIEAVWLSRDVDYNTVMPEDLDDIFAEYQLSFGLGKKKEISDSSTSS